MNSYLLKHQFGAITQPLRMAHHQTQINAVESERKTIEKIGPSTLMAISLDKAINDRCSLKRDISLHKRVRFYQ
jgi:hypothetical protein